LLVDGELAVEITIVERGVPPEFRVYAYRDEQPLDPAEVKLAIDLHRFGGRVDHFVFEPRDGYLLGDQEVEEPHSFDVAVQAEHSGASHRWQYDSYEGRTEISPGAIAGSGITIETAGPATIRTFVKAHGRILPNEDQLASYVPRYPGVVKKVRKRLGDRVERGDVLAVIESNESLQSYEVKSSIAGTVIAKNITLGEFTAESRAIYTVADLSRVWADLYVSREDFERLQIGQRAIVQTADGDAKAEAPVAYLSPFGAEETQKLLARVEIPNTSGEWRPGLFVTGEILVEEANVPVAVKTSALQTFRDWEVVFLNEGAVFQVAPLALGRRDPEWAEVTSGLKGGERYAADGSFIVKADVGKSGASHDH
jgi:cobalt-zinc-cadmium efflux system membrane fusion protein